MTTVKQTSDKGITTINEALSKVQNTNKKISHVSFSNNTVISTGSFTNSAGRRQTIHSLRSV